VKDESIVKVGLTHQTLIFFPRRQELALLLRFSPGWQAFSQPRAAGERHTQFQKNDSDVGLTVYLGYDAIVANRKMLIRNSGYLIFFPRPTNELALL
jgi:hypothetical protein